MLKTQRTITGISGYNLHLVALCTSLRKALMSSGTTHIERTKDVNREELTSDATVMEVVQQSPTVKRLRLRVDNKNLTFKAGQWVDFFIPDLRTVGGFSMCSSPFLLKSKGILELAVKISDHPPAQWVHSKCRSGDSVSVRVGGEVFHDPKGEDLAKDILLIAGGIGINPLFSIAQHMSDIHRYIENPANNSGKTRLLYASSNVEELIFKEKIHQLSLEDPLMSYKFFVTKEQIPSASDIFSNRLIGGRIKKSTLEESISDLTDNPSTLLCFICGPPPMIQDMSKFLLDLGLKDSQIRYEKWW